MPTTRTHRRRAGGAHSLARPCATRLLLATATALALGLGLPGGAAHAQDATTQSETRVYDIPAGPLGEALNRFASESGITLSFDPALVAQHTAPALQGRYSVAAGLQALLGGFGLSAVPGRAGGYRVQSAGRGDAGPLQLGPIQVTGTLVGTRIGETAEESSASVQVFTGEELQERPDTQEVRDLYDQTPNVVDFGEGAFAPAVRGVDGTGQPSSFWAPSSSCSTATCWRSRRRSAGRRR